jgi:WD repeat-containing protein 19
VLPSHAPLLGAVVGQGVRTTAARARDIFSANLMLGRGPSAWGTMLTAAAAGDSKLVEAGLVMCNAVAARALEALNPSLARQAYRSMGEPGIALSLEGVELGGEDRAHIAGEVCLLFRDYAAAQEAFCESKRPRSALELRSDLREWEAAERLAQALDPNSAPRVALERAKSEEMAGANESALAGYKDTLARAEALLKGAEAQIRELALGTSTGTGMGAAAAAAGAAGAAPAAPILGWYAETGATVASNAAAAASASAARAVMQAASAGIARCTLKCGDVRAGAALALGLGDAQLCRECGGMAESVGAIADAASLYRAGGAYDKAAELYLRIGAIKSCEPLLERVGSLRLQCSFGAALEKEGNYLGAALAYERGRDMSSMVRLMLEKLSMAPRAAELVRAVGSREGAALMAAHCASGGDLKGAIEFLQLAGNGEEAFALAVKSGEMEVYVGVLVQLAVGEAGEVGGGGGTGGGGGGGGGGGSGASGAAAAAPTATNAQLSLLPKAECLRIGSYYEAKGHSQALRAAQFFAAAGEFMRALALLLAAASPAAQDAAAAAASTSPTAASLIEEAVRLAGRAQVAPVTARLLSFLRGEGPEDGPPKDSMFIFTLQMALGNHGAAAAEALSIARCEQESPSGSFKTAHGILFDAYCALLAAGATVPNELWRTLALLHSYLLVKKLIGAFDHLGAARMLARVVKSISRFPAHATPILTSTVIQCQRGGLKATAYELACTLQLPAHRGAVKEEFRKKIEAMVRKPTGEEDAPHTPSPCPFCDAPVPSYNLSCASCQSTIPFCVVTGKHMTREDCSQCPSCRFPALFSSLSSAAAGGGYSCPMCSSPIAPQSIALHRDPLAFLRGVVGSDESQGSEGGDS